MALMAPAHPPESPQKAAAQPKGAPLDGDSPGVAAGVMHGRMLQVSRLATIGEMAAGVAHELNQPLTAIANYAQACDRLLSRPGVNLDDIRTAMREIAGQAVRAGDILRRLRSLAQSQPMRRERADLNATIEAIRDLILADVRVHRARVQFELAATIVLPHVILLPSASSAMLPDPSRLPVSFRFGRKPQRGRGVCRRRRQKSRANWGEMLNQAVTMTLWVRSCIS
jgi:signal transduction histidine kinase